MRFEKPLMHVAQEAIPRATMRREVFMPRTNASQISSTPKRAKPTVGNRRFGDALSIAEKQGLLSGARTLTVRGRMPLLLVEQAKKKTGIQSDSKLIEAALANIVAADDYADWLLAQRGTVSKDLDLEF
jgi:hypothetical protein